MRTPCPGRLLSKCGVGHCPWVFIVQVRGPPLRMWALKLAGPKSGFLRRARRNTIASFLPFAAGSLLPFLFLLSFCFCCFSGLRFFHCLLPPPPICISPLSFCFLLSLLFFFSHCVFRRRTENGETPKQPMLLFLWQARLESSCYEWALGICLISYQKNVKNKTTPIREETKGWFRKRVLAYVPSLLFLAPGNICMYPRSGFWYRGTSVVPGNIWFLVAGNIRQSHLLETSVHPFANLRKTKTLQFLVSPLLLRKTPQQKIDIVNWGGGGGLNLTVNFEVDNTIFRRECFPLLFYPLFTLHIQIIFHAQSFVLRMTFPKNYTSVTLPICIAVLSLPQSPEEGETISGRLPFASRYASHLYRNTPPHLYHNTFGKLLVVGVTEIWKNLKGTLPKGTGRIWEFK